MGSINIDMDGVLAIYNREDYMNGKNKHEIPGEHYFAYRTPDDRMCRALKILFDAASRSCRQPGRQKDVQIHIVSALSAPGHIFVEQLEDKLEWIDRHFKIKGYNLLLPVAYSNETSTKALRVSAESNSSLNLTDVLVDDYNLHLNAWAKCGGLAVKYINGVNSADSWQGPCITPEMTAQDIAIMLSALSGDKGLLESLIKHKQQNK